MNNQSVGELWRAAFRHEEDAYQVSLPDRAFFVRLLRSPYMKHIRRYAQPKRLERVLEGGCGSGKFSVCFAIMGLRATALDYSPRMAANALNLKQAAAGYFGQLALEAAVGDLTHLPFADDSYSLVFNEGVVEHWLDDSQRLKVIAEMSRVTLPGGTVAIIVPNGGHPLNGYWMKHHPGYLSAPPMTLYTSAQLVAEMKEVGLQDVYADGIGTFSGLAFTFPHSRLMRLASGALNHTLPIPRYLRQRMAVHIIALGRKPAGMRAVKR